MSTSGTSPHKEDAQEIVLLKEQTVEMIRMMQQLVIGGGQNSFGHSQGGPQFDNENQPPPVQNQGYKVEFNQPFCWLYSVPNLLII